MSAHPDVIVVGAGIAGAAAAFHLAERCVDVTLLERSTPASGPSGRSGALSHAFYFMPELSQLARNGTNFLRAMPERTGHPSDFREVGLLWGFGEALVEDVGRTVERVRAEGTPLELLTPAELLDRAPGFTADGLAVALWEPSAGYPDPATATTGIVAAARERGATVRLNTPIARLARNGSRVTGVETLGGELVEAGTVVLATGPWTGPLLAAIGVSLPLTMERHSIMALDVPDRAREVLPFTWCDDTLVHYARPDGEHRVLIGSWAGGGTGYRHPDVPRAEVTNPDVYQQTVSDREAAWILDLMLPRLPALADLPFGRGWACVYDMSPDDLPVIGSVGGVDGLVVVAGSSGHGFKLGPAVGEEVARLVATGEAPLLAPFTPDRFAVAA
ncbi:MAG: FAD-binding oxidoreductase [Thermoleophilia bacterium]|nr:FAD-binding oxidoreductase [Thermoleophilia bacterium]